MERRNGHILLELTITLAVMGLAVYGMGETADTSGKANAAEVKANLHAIQLQCERFSVDTDGIYPAYLIGGEARYAARVDPAAADVFQDITEYVNRDAVSDPLLRLGYFAAYPGNPFIKNGASVHLVQYNLPTSIQYCDPLRNGPDAAGAEGAGTRFGALCTTMGNVYADPRYGTFVTRDSDSGAMVLRDTWATIEYDMWDMWTGDQPLPYLTGEFFYKGAGTLRLNWPDGQAPPMHPSVDAPQEPQGTQFYIMGCFGGPQDKGKDIVGEERPLVYHRRNQAGEELKLTVWSWTRSQVSPDPTALAGCPYLPDPALGGQAAKYDLQFGNPNGIRDALILVLTSGESPADER